jgi:hypothetical protein
MRLRLTRLAAATATAGTALAVALPARAAVTPAMDVGAARAVAHAFVVKAAKKAGLTNYFLECSQLRPSTPLGPAVITYLDAGTELDAIVVVRNKVGAYKVATVVTEQTIDCGREWALAA